MTFKEIVHISGKSGLYLMIKEHAGGILAKALDEEGKTQFMSNRHYGASLLYGIELYIMEDDGKKSIPLIDVFRLMETADDEDGLAPPPPKSSPVELRTYLEKVLPNFDREAVKISDIQRLVRWYVILKPLDVFNEEEEENEEENASENTDSKSEEE